MWREEHAGAFTVAKAMRLDALSGPRNAVIKAVEKGWSFDTFKKNAAPILRQKGWRGKKEMTDPLAGETVNARLGSARRLKTIYRVNMRSACQKGQYERTMRSELRPYLMYRIGPGVNRRAGRPYFAQNRPVAGFAFPAKRLRLQLLHLRRIRIPKKTI